MRDAESQPPVPAAEIAEGFHTAALGLWLLAALIPTALTRNPYYLAGALALVGFCHLRLARGSAAGAAWGAFVRLSLVFVAFTLVANALLGGLGETALVELPAWRWRGPSGEVLFQLGGAVTLESLVYGLTSALALLTVIVAFATFNALVDPYQLMRAMPPFLHQAATVTSIALAFVPQLVRAQREIREAQALRGHRVRGLRDLLPLVVTLLAEGLERAMSLAESMAARGFSGAPLSPRERHLPRLAIALSLALLLGGLVARGLGWAETAGLAALVLGALVLGATLYHLGRRQRRSRYRRERWRRRDSALAAAALASLGGLLVLRLGDPARLAFDPFPRLGQPSFEPLVALALAPLAVLAFLERR